MKKLSIFLLGLFFTGSLQAQNITDALRFSDDNIQGTARFRALSGAFGALGGDMSAVSINPAGSAVFNNSHASFSLINNKKDNKASYFGNLNSSSNSDLGFNQAGAAIVLNNTNPNSDWKKITFGFAYDRANNYQNDWLAYGVNSNSISSYFTNNAQGFELSTFTPTEAQLSEYFNIDQLTIKNNTELFYELGYQYLGERKGYQEQQNFLGYYSYILEPEEFTDNNSSYNSNIFGDRFVQDYQYLATGYNGKISFNLATQYKDDLYLGVNFNAHFIDYERSTGLYETNNETGAVINEVYFENGLRTFGNGFSFQIGGIAKLTDELRVGLTYNTPTIYTIQDETWQYLETSSYDGIPLTEGEPFELGTIEPNVINIYPEYKVKTPSKVMGSLAYIFGKEGLISFDYSIKDYSNIELRPVSDDHFSFQNQLISNNLKSAASYNLGGEYRYKEFSFRGGYRFEESPYVDETTVGDLTGYSLGLGYSFGRTKFDIAYDAFERDTNYQLFDVGLTDSANLNTRNSNITLSMSFDF